MMNNSNQNKANLLSQNQLFESKYLTYLRQLSQNQQKIDKPNYFNLQNLQQLNNEIQLLPYKFLYKSYPLECYSDENLQNGKEQIIKNINQFKNQIDKLDKKLQITKQTKCQDDTDYNDQDIQESSRRRHFQELQQSGKSLELVIQYPFQISNQQSQTDYQYLIQRGMLDFSQVYHARNFNLLNLQLNSFSMNQQYIQPFMRCQSIQNQSELVILDQLFKHINDKLTEIKSFTLHINFKNKISLFSFYRYAISLQCNVIIIDDLNEQDDYYYSRNRNRNKDKNNNLKKSEVMDILEDAFIAILSNKNLQSLIIKAKCEQIFESFISALTSVGLVESALSVLVLQQNQNDLEEQQITTFINCLNQLPHLKRLELPKIKIQTQEQLNGLNKLLDKLEYANLSVSSIPDTLRCKFNFQKVQILGLQLDHAEKNLTHEQSIDLAESLCQGQNLEIINLNVQKYIPTEEEQKQSKKQKKQKKKDQKLEKLKEQEQIDQKNNLDISNQLTTKIQESLDNIQIQLPLLDKGSYNTMYNHITYYTYLRILKNNQKFQNFKINCQKQIICKDKEQVSSNNKNNDNKKIVQENKIISQEIISIDTKELYEIICQHKSLEIFKFNHDCLRIKYKRTFKDMNFYELNLEIQKQQPHFEQVLQLQNCFNFSLMNLKKVEIKTPFEVDNLTFIDTICQSLSSSSLIEEIHLNIFDVFESKICRQKVNYNYPNLQFFAHLANLQQLEYLSIDIPINQDILNSLQKFIQVNRSLKYLKFIRNQYYYQYDVDYTQFFKEVQNSVTLQHLSIDLKMENTKIYQEVPLDTFNTLKRNAFYKPFCDLIINRNKQLQFIEYNEEILNNQEMEIILNSIVLCQSQLYFILDDKLISNIVKDKKLHSLMEQCDDKGYLAKQNIQTPLLQYYK